ncbi:hypothetical protein CsSME_00033834 [Camellia sinensis var. sinensis]
MASSATVSSSAFINKKDVGLSAFSTQTSFSIQNPKKTVSRKIVSVMAPQQFERKPATTGKDSDDDDREDLGQGF